MKTVTLTDKKITWRAMSTITITVLMIFSIGISTVFAQTTYYSRTDGDWSNPDSWSTSSCAGSAGASTPTAADNVIICAGIVITLSQNVAINDLTINNTGQLDVTTANFNIELSGDWVSYGDTMSPSFDARSATVTLNGTSLQLMEGETEFYHLIIDNSAGVTINSGVQGIGGTLRLTDGLLNTNDSLTLRSDTNGTARIAEITGGSIDGDVITERYVIQGDNNWRFFSTPVAGATLAEWQDDFVTSGFPGSDYPAFGFSSIYTYDETALGPGSNGYEAPTNISDPINIGEGYWVYLGPLPLTFEVKGPANTGNFSLPVSYTYDVSQPPAENGWNMVGNPYASSIDWDSPYWTKTNIGSTIYIYKDDGSYATYPAGGPGTNGGTKDIASSQGFWVQSTGFNPILTATEGVKSSADASFLKNSGPAAHLKLDISSNGYTDEAIIRFYPGALDGLDNLDGYKLANPNPQIPNISTVVDNENLVINSMSDSTDEFSIPIKALFEDTGTYTIQITKSGLVIPSNSMLVLEDLLTGIITDLTVDSTCKFTVSSLSNSPRFMLHLQKGFTLSSEDVKCNGKNNGSAVVTVFGNGPWAYTWTRANGDTIMTTTNNANTDSIQGLAPGSYAFYVSDLGGYYTDLYSEFSINEPASISATALLSDPSCYGGNNGSIQMNVYGGVGVYQYSWSNSSSETTSVISNLTFGLYHVTISDQNACEIIHTSQVNQPEVLAILNQTTNVSCFGDDDGQIDLTVTGGTAPYNYSWSNGEATEDVTNLSPGTFDIIITDNNGCSVNGALAVTEPEQVIANFNILNKMLQLSDGGVGEFENTSTGATSYLWDFSDGSYSTDENPVHAFTAAGYYQVSLTAYNGPCESQAYQIIGIIDNTVGISGMNNNNSPVSVSQSGREILIRFNFEKPAHVSVSIHNLLGQVIVSDDQRTITGEVLSYTLQGKHPGIYLVSVEYLNQVSVTKLLVTGN